MSDKTTSTVKRRTVLNSTAISIGSVVGLSSTGVARDSRGRLSAPSVRGSVEQVAVTEAVPGAEIRLLTRGQREVETAEANENGTALFRDVEPGNGYRVTQTTATEESRPSNAVRVLPREYTPPQGFYERQTLERGYGYFEVRDGTTLGYQLLTPDEDEWGEPPYPTVIDYSGYEPSHTIYDGLDDRFLELGYAVVGVNKRGTGCSGWAFDYFEWLQRADGYDMVETIAAQDWSDGVALVGKSYPGITQLHVASMQPPSLDAIVPGHVVGDSYRDIAYPGGIQNAIYAVGWAERQEAISNFPSLYDWVNERADTADQTCAENQLLRGHNVPLLDPIFANETDSEFWRSRAARNLVEDIEVPTMLVNSWQDETTGGRPAMLLEQFDEAVPLRFVGTNGDHSEYYGDVVFEDIARFLSYYVNEEVPNSDGQYNTFEDALTAYEEEDPVRIYWEMGAEGDRVPNSHTDFSAWPPDETDAWRLYLHPDGTLREKKAGGMATSEYTYDPSDPEAQLGRYWDHPPDGEVARFVTEPLREDVTLLGSASVDLWVQSSQPDTDFEVTLTEVRPDGTEMYVQTGWLRASHRAEDDALSTELRPWHTHRSEDLEELAENEFTKLRVELFPFGHLFREGSRIQLCIEAPGGNRRRWGFDAIEGPAVNEIAHGENLPSSIVLPFIPDHAIQTDLPPCQEIREQPCREAKLPFDDEELR